MASSHHLTHPSLSLSSFGAASVMLCCSASPASSSALLWPSVRYPSIDSVRYPSIDLVVNIIWIRTFCDDINVLHIFDQTCIVLKPGWSSPTAQINTRRIVNPPSLSPSYPPTPPPSQSPAFTTLPPPRQVSARLAPLVQSSAVFLLPRWLDKFISAVSSCLKSRSIKFVLP